MELVVFTLVAAALYGLSDVVLRVMERAAGRRFEHRSLIFFAMLLGSALATFSAIRTFFDG
ncbi:MAG: hypothetical protein ACE5DS_01635 [Kiloniellaceae bacterium]